MKNTIIYYYLMYPKNIHKIDDYYFFYYEKNKYFLLPFYRDLKDVQPIVELCNSVYNSVPYIHTIIMNKDKSPITYVNNAPYMLVKAYVDESGISLDSISKIAIPVVNTILNRSDWFLLWSRKIDYIEYQMNEVGRNFEVIKESLSYYIGLAENALLYIKNTKKEYTDHVFPMVISHERVGVGSTLFDLCNPITFIIDHKSRDVSEYLKSLFFNGKDVWEEMHRYFRENKYTNYDYRMFFGRMLYPSYYFDLYEKVIKEEIEEKELYKIISKIELYEEFLSDLYNYICSITPIPGIDWLLK